MIRVAILGAGIGAEHLRAYRALSGHFSVELIVDRDLARAQALAGGVIAVADRAEEAFHDPDIDLVDVCLPPHLHVSMTLEALAAGKHVVCEKPMATSLANVARVAEAAQSARRRVFPVFQYRWGGGLAILRHLMACGFAGRPLMAAVETHWNRGAPYYAVPWRGTWSGEQGGAVLGHAIHNHDLLTHVMGPVRGVSASTATRVNPIETEDCAAIAFEFESGALATSSVTLGAARDETRLRFVFDALTATSDITPYAPGLGTWDFRARDPGRAAELAALVSATPCEAAGFEGFFHAVGEALLGRHSAAVTLEEGAASIELVTAIYHAARSGQRVTLPLAPDHPLYGGWQP